MEKRCSGVFLSYFLSLFFPDLNKKRVTNDL